MARVGAYDEVIAYTSRDTTLGNRSSAQWQLFHRSVHKVDDAGQNDLENAITTTGVRGAPTRYR
ncbi:hypothetical protein AbraIFM66950_009620 [Aspergillus brasiliensis]|nr:hypothetical protein AbraIFM66950_009620 [Aspergillus brasiliensis]